MQVNRRSRTLVGLFCVFLFVTLVWWSNTAPTKRNTPSISTSAVSPTYGEIRFFSCDKHAGQAEQFWKYYYVNITCRDLFQAMLDESKLPEPQWPPPAEIPQHMLADYTLNGQVPVSSFYLHQRYNGAPEPLEWTQEYVDKFLKNAARRGEFETYLQDTFGLYAALEEYVDELKGKRAAVFGSETPWVEAMALTTAGAAEVLTIEYREINTYDPRMKAMTPYQLARAFLDNQLPQYDFGISFSSYEHDGLGRYGDRLNPFADLLSVQKVSCLIKPDGLFFLTVPTGPDRIEWNAHRIYGPIRFPLMTANFEVLGMFNSRERHITLYPYLQALFQEQLGTQEQPVVVLRNKRTTPC